MSNIILVAETGSDITAEVAKELGIMLVPMHVSLGSTTLDDGSFPVDEICNYYNTTGTLPKTSGCSPSDFDDMFKDLHQRFPDKKILHLAYSAVTTCSFQSAVIASDGADYILSVDTKHVSAGQASIVIKMADVLKSNPLLSLNEAGKIAQDISKKTKMCFLPDNLEYLRAGGRVSNVAFLGSRLLSLHPCIEIDDGKLIAKKKYRGKLERVIPNLIAEYAENEQLDKKHLYLLWSIGLSDKIKQVAEEAARDCGFESTTWVQTGCVITTHCGPGTFGLVGFSNKL